MSNEITVNPKAQFIEDVKKWATLDSQLKIVNEKMRKKNIYVLTSVFLQKYFLIYLII
jgi:hypothetical protein